MAWLTKLVAAPRFQRWAAAFPLTRGRVKREGEALFDLVAGFCHSQILAALVELEVMERLAERAQTVEAIAADVAVPGDRMEVLLRGGIALGLLRRTRKDRFLPTTRGAAMLGVPGLRAMIRHHSVLYHDLRNPTAFFRGQTAPELAHFWPYVFGAGQAEDPETVAIYSDLMAESQAMVADDTLRAVSLANAAKVMDIGGGTGAFLTAVGKKYPKADLCLFDLPAVVPGAEERFAAAKMRHRVAIVPGSFRDDMLPQGADVISLVRVLYDHRDETVRGLLAAVFAALPPGGRLIISEPMSGGDRPERAGDAYFALYTMAMGTGRARSAEEIKALCLEAGFQRAKSPRPARPFVTRVVVAQKAK